MIEVGGFPARLSWLHDLVIEANDDVVKGATKWYKSYPQKRS
jgi:hypothetical protein